MYSMIDNAFKFLKDVWIEMKLNVEIFAIAVTLFHYYTYMKSIKSIQLYKLMISCLFLALKLKNRLNSKSLQELKNCFNKYADCQPVEQLEINTFEMELLIFLGFELDIETSFTSFDILYSSLNIKEFLSTLLNSQNKCNDIEGEFKYDEKYKFIKFIKSNKVIEDKIIREEKNDNYQIEINPTDKDNTFNNLNNNNHEVKNENKNFQYNINISDTPDENFNNQTVFNQKMVIEENIDHKNLNISQTLSEMKKQSAFISDNKRKTIEIIEDSKNLNQIMKDDKIYKIDDLRQSEEKFLSLFTNLCFTVLLDVYRRPFCIVFKSKSIAFSIFLLCLDLIIAEYKLNIEVNEKYFLDEFYKDVDYNDFINCRKEIITFMNSCQW